MKSFYSILLLILIGQGIKSQTCNPDSTYRDSTVGVYPKPITPDGTSKGINIPACINKPYTFDFTVIVPDTVRIQGILLNLVSAKLETSGAIANLPQGISYSCNPPNCVYPAKTFGCLRLQGTPTSANTPGDFKPIISLSIVTPFGPFAVTYPGTFPGEYILKLYDENCLIATKDLSSLSENFYPNPAEGWVTSKDENISDLSLSDMNGKIITTQSKIVNNKFVFPTNLSNGMYLLNWKSNNKSYIQKIIVNQ